MAVAGSYLSAAKYGYDFVVATTQASINSGLRAYLSAANQPVDYICFLADPKTGNPSEQISLDDLLKKTGDVNPFDIPAGTAYDDPRITTLTHNLFVAGVKIQMGLPPGVLPKDLPLVVTLGTSADNVLFNLFSSQFEVIQNSPPSGFGGSGVWNVWSQPSGKPWYVTTRVNLVVKDLDKSLDTPYFNNNPKLKQALLNKLVNLSGSAFSLQQLLFDLDNATMQTVPQFEGIPAGSNAELILQKSFVDIYSANAKKYGAPLVSVKAVAQTADNSTLRLTGFEREVSPMKDGSGSVIENPTAAQKEATTLDYLCAVNNHALPGAATFSWNWVTPEEIDEESGVISINRNTIANYVMQQLVPHVRRSCIKATTSVHAHFFGKVDYSWGLQAGQTPKSTEVTASGAKVVEIKYDDASRAHDKSGLTAGELKINPSFTCDVSFQGSTMTVTQRLLVYTYARWDNTGDGINAFDKTITDTYTLSVDQNGGLKTTKTGSSSKDNSQSANRSGIINFFTGINDLVNDIKKKVTGFVTTELGDIPVNDLQSFVFPGGQVFVYKSVGFSDHQDLVTEITYVKPS